MKARSFCGGCGRRGHWHKDEACPLNAKGVKPDGNPKEVAMTTVLPADVFALKHMSSNLVGVADTACARTVAGSQWLQSYTNLLSGMGQKPHLQKECEAYRFGTGRVHILFVLRHRELSLGELHHSGSDLNNHWRHPLVAKQDGSREAWNAVRCRKGHG